MTQIPQNVSQFTPANAGGGAFFVGSTLANLRGLNPFFGTRTLTLVDSRRFIATTQGDAVDLNFIPTNLVQQMQTVTGGASAAYGSGAISGVVNVILDKRLDSLKLDLDYGGTFRGDGNNYRIGIADGFSFADGRGHIVVGGEYQNSDVIQSCADARDWCGKGRGLYSNTADFVFAAGQPFTPNIPGQPHFILVQGLRANQTSINGVIFGAAPGATSTFQFNEAGTGVAPFAIGQDGWRSTGGNVVGGDGDRAYTNLSLYPQVQRGTFFSHGEFDFNDRLAGYAELSYGHVKARNNQWDTGQNTAQNCILPDNAYVAGLSAQAQAALAAGIGNSAFATFPNQLCFGGTIVSKNWRDQVDQNVFTDTEVWRGVLGLNGKFAETWAWDAYYQYGRTVRDQIGSGYRTNWRYTMATDAVIDTRAGSATLGQAICRSDIIGAPFGADPALAAGCRPLNVFGLTASPEALAYAFGALTEHNVIRQDVLAGTINGQLWEGWGAGALSAAFGLEWRKDSLTNDAGNLPFAQRTDFALQYGDSFAGSTEVYEGFAEFEMPLLANLPLAKIWTLNAAARTARYKTVGGMGTVGGTNEQDINTWKLATVWDINDWLRVRGSQSRDIRAAGFRELFYSQSIPPGGFFGSVSNPWIIVDPNIPGSSATDSATLILNGNPAIEPERATTSTIGLVLTPQGSGLQFSADYYRIKLTGGMALEVTQGNVNDCFDGVQAACGLLTFGEPLLGQETNPNAQFTNIVSARALYRNQSPYETQGIDFALNYSTPLDSLFSGAPGIVTFNMTASHTLETIVPSGVDVAGQTGGDQGFLSDFSSSPDWTGNLTVSYANGPFAATVQARYVAAGVLDLQNPKTGPDSPDYDATLSYSVTDNTVPSYWLFSLNGSYDFKWFGLERTQVFASINNLFDKDPPFSAGAVGGANAIFFDALGRSYRLGVRVKF
jgi:outer membrane receptor protein involved in Fe transport